MPRPSMVRPSNTELVAESRTPGSGLSAMLLNRLKMAALPAMPSVSTAITTNENAGFFPSMRVPKRTSCQRSISSAVALPRQTCRASSLACSTLPNSLIAASRADSGSSPPAMRSAIAISKWFRISASMSRSIDLRRNSQCSRFMSAFTTARVENRADRVDELRPAIAFLQELLLALRRQPVKLGALVGVGRLPVALHPPLPFEPMQRGVEGAGLDLERLGRLGADRLADRVAVLRPPLQRLKDQHVERALQDLQTRPIALLFPRL